MAKKTFEERLKKGLEKWSDEECLNYFTMFLNRIEVGSGFLQDDNGFFTHEVLQIACGEKMTTSDPMRLDWPLEPVRMPEGMPKKDLN